MLIDVNKCSGCYNCFLACRDEYFGNDYPGYSAAQPLTGQFWMQVKEIERGSYPKPKVAYLPTPCQHCEDAPCIDAAKDKAVYRRDDGIVIIDPAKAVGQEAIAAACPFRVIYWNADKQLPQKCTLCAHRLDEGEKQPRCVESCPTGALTFGDLDDPESDIAHAMADLPTEDLRPDFGSRPMVKYVGVPKRFIAGEVVLGDCQDECAENVSVTLEGDDVPQSTATDIFGDFEFEGLKQGGAYRVVVTKPGYRDKTIDVCLKKDMHLGTVQLDPAV
jgi:Fe-S-cluster-containing dehydrogenase component